MQWTEDEKVTEYGANFTHELSINLNNKRRTKMRIILRQKQD